MQGFHNEMCIRDSIKTMLIDQKSKLTVIRISEYEIPERDGVLSYTREYIELRSKSQTNEKNWKSDPKSYIYRVAEI